MGRGEGFFDPISRRLPKFGAVSLSYAVEVMDEDEDRAIAPSTVQILPTSTENVPPYVSIYLPD